MPNTLFTVLVIVILMPIILGMGVLIEFRSLRRRLDKRIGKIEEDVEHLKGKDKGSDKS